MAISRGLSNRMMSQDDESWTQLPVFVVALTP